MTLGERILVLRRRARLSQDALGRLAGIDGNTIARLERNEMRDLMGANIAKLARALHVSTDTLLGLVSLDEDDNSAPAQLAAAG